MSDSEELDQLFGEETRATVSTDEQSDRDMDTDESLSPTRKHLPVPTPAVSVTIPPITRPIDKGFMPYLLRLPGFVSLQQAPYRGDASLKTELADPDTLDYGDLLRAQTTIRNRKRGSATESNARLNRWSDGSWTLQVGAEQFEVLPQSFTEDEHNLLFVSHGGVIEATGRLVNKLTVRPFMDAAGSHRKFLALAEATGKGMKKTKVRVATTVADPEKEKQKLVRLQQERVKARRKLDAKRRNIQQREYERVGRDGLSARFLEAGEDDEDEYEEEGDEYEADFIDDAEIEDGDEEEEEEEEEDDDGASVSEDETRKQPSKEPKEGDYRSRTSRLIFDDDDDE